MYNETIDIKNKIITGDTLLKLFEMINEKKTKYDKVYETEEKKNEILERDYQEWTLYYYSSRLSITIDFYDKTSVTYDNYTSFITAYNNRIQDIKHIDISFSFSYEDFGQNLFDVKTHRNHIYLYIVENKFKAEIEYPTNESKYNVKDIYDYIKNIEANAHPRNSFIIKKMDKIYNRVRFSYGLMIGPIIGALFLLVPEFRSNNKSIFFLYPLISIVISYLIGSIFSTHKLSDLYEKISPEKESYYDSNFNRRFKYNIEEYENSSEVCIGYYTDSVKARQSIYVIYKKNNSTLIYKIGFLLLLSLIFIII